MLTTQENDYHKRFQGEKMADITRQIHERAKARGGRIVLSEGEDSRMLVAARTLVDRDVCEVTLVGDATTVTDAARDAGISLDGVTVTDPKQHERKAEFADTLLELRKKKGMTAEQAAEAAMDPLIAAALMVRLGDGTATVGGAVHATRDVVRAALWCLGIAPGVSVVSGAFLMVVPDFLGSGEEKALFFADSGVVPDPDAAQLASIAVASADTFSKLTGEEARVAMLSFSTKGSASHEDVDKVIEATRLAKEMSPDMCIDGELQADAALVSSVGKSKAPGSPVAGEANVLVFPDLGAGNIGYKLVQRLAKAAALGPILQGLSKPAHDLSRGCSANDIVDMAAIALCMV